jgi:hypothetical protein
MAGSERRDRDDEEEQGRIPIPLSDDSDEYTWLDELVDDESGSEQEQEMGPSSRLNLKQAVLKLEEKEAIKKTRQSHRH